MRDVWLILCAAAAMLTAVPALRRLDAAIDERMKQESAGDDQASGSGEAPEPERSEQ